MPLYSTGLQSSTKQGPSRRMLKVLNADQSPMRSLKGVILRLDDVCDDICRAK